MADQITTSLAEAKILVMEGKAGYSPQIEVRDVTSGHQIRITTKISSTQYQTDVFNVMDGKDGEPGSPGAPGFSPTVSVQDIAEPLPGGGAKVIGHTVTITDAAGAHTFNVMNGEDGDGGGGSYDPDEELAKSFQLTVSGTTVTLNDTAVNVSAAIQSARPVLFYTVSGGSFTFFGVSGMDYETGEIRLTTLFDGSRQTVTLTPSGITMAGTLVTTPLNELPAVTAQDNGKSLVVEGGKWVAGSGGSGLPDTTSASAGDFLRLDAQNNAAWETISSVMGASIPLGD